ncbi:MAG TPA: polysaccharide deacetylase family protein [Burkholderiales bacterium]|nr:polysaccharide deacetylase family protein [Burkholderiales bacterium]
MIAALQRYGRGLSRRVGRALRRRIQPNALVLVYHRIAEPLDPDPWGLCVAPERFREQLDVLMRDTEVVPLAELRHAARRGFGRPRVAVTIDDGYADALHRALPLLERHGLPATVFVPTGLVGDDAGFWWDALADALLGAGQRPPSLALVPPALEWSGPTASAAARAAAHDVLYALLRTAAPAARRATLAALSHWSDARAPRDPLRRPLRADELAELLRSPLIELGAHTVGHRWLPGCTADELAREVDGSLADCARIGGREPAAFAYPYGFHDDAARARVTAAGFGLACAGGAGLVWPDTDPLALPRYPVLDWDGAAFAERLRWTWTP